MCKVLIIGWGNPLRGDDGVGWKAAERLSALLAGHDVEVLVSHQLMPEFAEAMSRSDLVIFIDAACDNGPGADSDVAFRRVEPRSSQASFSHQLDPAALLGMAERLYGAAPTAYLCSLRGRRWDFSEEFSPEVEAALPRLLAQVEELCRAAARTA